MNTESVINLLDKMASIEEYELFTPIVNPDITALEYPFAFITDTDDSLYKVKDFCRGIPSEEPCSPGDFPNNITQYYLIHEGENDEDDWMCLCKLTNGYYVFYTASCDYTGFDCQGGMEMIISRDLKRLFYEGLTETQRKECLNSKLGTNYK